ncbi:MAG: T9SS type A sorting domain-containing protein [Saprospiraceae bacterium]|nr:T9SS type A sorting domain-containing protein [Saprospiraceae bacterium]
MKKFSPLFLGGLFFFALLQLIPLQNIHAQSSRSGVTIRVTVDGTPTDFVEGTCGFGYALFGGFPSEEICAPISWAHDVIGQDSIVCDSIPVGSLTGKIGMVRRGGCTVAANGAFIAKSFNAQRAGALAVFIANNSATANQTNCYVQTAGGTSSTVTVPVFFLSREMANFINAAVVGGQAVEVCILPPNVLINSAFYPAQNVQTPVSQIATDTMGFSANITNTRGVDLTNVVVSAKVETAAGAELFSTSLTIPSLTADVSDSLFQLPGLFVPELPVGDYVFHYSTSSDPDGQYSIRHDFRDGFKVTNSLFAKDDNVGTHANITALQPGTLPDAGWAVGNLYIMSSGAQDDYVVRTVEFSHAVNAGTVPINQVGADMFLFKVNDDVVADWNLFEGADFLSPSFEWIGTGSYEAPANAANFQLQQVQLIDLVNALPGVPVEAGDTYVLAAFYPDSNKVVFNTFDFDAETAGPEGINTLSYSSQWFLGGFSSGCCAVLRMYIDLATTTDEHQLPETSMQVFPNPVKDVLNLGLNLDKPTDITVTIAEISGRTIRIEDKQGMTNETLTYQLPQLASGTYLARIATKEGTLTKKFVVQK